MKLRFGQFSSPAILMRLLSPPLASSTNGSQMVKGRLSCASQDRICYLATTIVLLNIHWLPPLLALALVVVEIVKNKLSPDQHEFPFESNF